jgi:putative ABC transport system permease protein
LLAFLKRNVGVQPVLVGKDLAKKLHPAPIDDRLDAGLKWLKRMPRFKDLADRLETVPVRIQAVGKEPQTFLKVGTVHASGPVGSIVNHCLFMNAADAADLAGLTDLVTRIDVFLRPGADRDLVSREIRSLLNGDATVQTPGENEERVQKLMAGLQMGFSLSGAGALVIGLFLVYMILTVTAADRRHEIGVLRSLGATRDQIWALFVAEALAMGLVGTAIGIPLGIYLADYLGLEPIRALLSDLIVPLENTRLEISIETLGIAAAATIAVRIPAAAPAIQAASEEPANAVRRGSMRPLVRQSMLLGALSILLFVLGAMGMFWRKELPERWGTYGGFVLVLLATLLTTPLLASLTARAVQPLVRSVLGVEGRLASDNLVRAPARTGLVITVLAAGVTLFMQTAGVIRSNREPIMEWVSEVMDADLLVNCGQSSTGTGQSLALPADLGREAERTIPEIEAALPIRYRQVDFRENRVFLLSLDAEGFATANRRLGTGTSRDLYPLLLGGGPPAALVSKNFEVLHQVRSGDMIEIRGPRGPLSLRVAGSVVDFNFPTGTIIIDRTAYLDAFEDPLVDEFYVYLRPRADAAAVRARLNEKWQQKHAITVMTRTEMLERYERMIQRFADVAYAQEVVVGLVAALGVAFALLISVMQRRRELGVLRAVGATQSQVMRCVLVEAALMGAIGTAIGLAIGLPIEWYCVHVILFEESGFLMPVRVPWQEAAFIGAGAMLIATLAGLWPAFQTSRARIPEAIAYE